MRQKNALEYIMLALFIMCMALSMSAVLEYASAAKERPYLLQGAQMLSLVLLSLAVYVGIRLVNKAAPHISNRAKNWIALGVCAVLFAAGLLLRIVVIERIPMEPESDFMTYYRIGGELLNDVLLTPEGEWDRSYIAQYPRTIGFPMLVLLPAFKLFGQSVKVALYANLVCSMVSIALCAYIGKRLAGRIGAVIATLLMSFWPSHVLYANMVATEPSFTMLLLMATVLMIGVLERNEDSLYARSPGRAVAYLMLVGVVLALAESVQSMAVVLLVSFAVVLLTRGGDPEGKVPLDGMRYVLATGWFCVLLVLIPYLTTGGIIRRGISDQILEAPASGLTASGYNLMVGVNVGAEGHWNEEDSTFFATVYDETGDASEAHRKCMQVAFQRITSEPENVLNLLIYKFRDLWQTDDFGIDWNLLWTDQQGTLTPELKQTLEDIRPVGRLMYMSVLLCALLCALSVWRGRRAPQPMVMVFVLFFLGTALSHMLLETQVRYHYNMLPFLILLATLGVGEWRQRMAEEPPVRVVYLEGEKMVKEHDDHTHFDMNAALREGHIIMTVTEKYQEEIPEAAPEAAPVEAPETAPVEAPEAAPAEAPEADSEADQEEAPEADREEAPEAAPAEAPEADQVEAPEADREECQKIDPEAEPETDQAEDPEAASEVDQEIDPEDDTKDESEPK